MKYKVIPFTGSLEQNKTQGKHVAEQLETIIQQQNAEGWDYVRLESVQSWVAGDKGCFGLGATAGHSTSKQVLVFKKEE
jgi:hypothetical protein